MAFHLVVVTRVNGTSGGPQDKGVFEDRKDAIASARQIIDEWIAQNHKPGMDAPSLFSQYLEFGVVPSIFGDESYTMGTAFDYTQYALDRAKEICGPG